MRPAYAVIVLGALVVAACGGYGNDDAPIETPTAQLAATPTPTVRTEVASSTLVPPVTQDRSEAACDDPYIGGAPYVPTPGTPVRLGPQGTSEPLAPYSFAAPRRDVTLERFVQTVLGEDEDRFAVVIKNLGDGSGIMLNPDRQFYAASLYKTWVMVEAFSQQQAGLLDWNEQYVVSAYYESWELNPGELQECDLVTLGEALDLMLSRSDNVAANVLLERVGSGNINRALTSLGLSRSGFLEGGGLPATARDMALLLEAIYARAAVSETAAAQMMVLLTSEQVNDRIPALLPQGTQVAHKTGFWETATHDAGIVLSDTATYIIVVLSDLGYLEGGAPIIATLSRAVYDYYNPR